MAEPNVGNVFDNLATQMAGLSTVIGAQGVAQIITPFDGDPKKFKTWIKAIEKYAILTNLAEDRIKTIAFQSSMGCVSDFIQRYMGDHPDRTWAEMKVELSARFAEVTDSAHALMLLRKVKQKFDENVQIYAERLLSLAEEAYAGIPDGGAAAIERQLIGFFIDGLAFDYLKMKVMRENPMTLQGAINSAMNEQNLRKRFNLRTGNKEIPKEANQTHHTPMEIGHYRPKRCYNCNRLGHTAKQCRNKNYNVNAINTTQQNTRKPFSEIICWRCHKKGHIRKNCKENLNYARTGSNQGN